MKNKLKIFVYTFLLKNAQDYNFNATEVNIFLL